MIKRRDRTTTFFLGSGVEIALVPAFDDNYIFIGKTLKSNLVFIVDPGESDAVQQHLKYHGLIPETLLITHEHDDHLGGAAELIHDFPGVQIIASPSSQKCLQTLLPSYQLNFLGADTGSILQNSLTLEVMNFPGHTFDHIGFWLPTEEFLFCGDVLFGLGCGRIINGTTIDHFHTLQKIKSLPTKSRIFCAHEYSMRNMDFLRQKINELPASLKIKYSLRNTPLDQIQQYLTDRIQSEGRTVPLDNWFEAANNPFLLIEDLKDFEMVRKLRDHF